MADGTGNGSYLPEVAAFGKFFLAMDYAMALEVLEHGEVFRSKNLAKSLFFGTVILLSVPFFTS